MNTTKNSLRAWARTQRDEMIEWSDLWRTLSVQCVIDVAHDLHPETLFTARGQADLAVAFESLARRSSSLFGEVAR